MRSRAVRVTVASITGIGTEGGWGVGGAPPIASRGEWSRLDLRKMRLDILVCAINGSDKKKKK